MHPYTTPVDPPHEASTPRRASVNAGLLAEMLHPSQFTNKGIEMRAHVLKVMDAAEATAMYLAGKIGWAEYRGTLLDLIDEEAER